MPNRIQIFDTTLRDGEQSPGCSMNAEEKLTMARQLERLGVDIIEAGFAASSQGDFDSVQQIGHSLQGPRVMTLCRVIDQDIDRGIEALQGSHKWGIHTFLGTSDLHLEYKLNLTRQEAIDKAVRAVERAKKHCDHIEFSAEDATRSDPAYLVEIFSAVVKAGATVLNVPDTVGYTTPLELYNLIERLNNEVYNADQIIFSVHNHNDLGLAVANSLAAIQAGAKQVECTINGIGERAGNAALEEIVMALKTRQGYYNFDTGIDTKQLTSSSRLLTKLTGQSVQANKSIVGANAFAHEAGIHQDGIIKNSLTYEIMSPESVGLNKNSLVLGKHSGRAALLARIEELGFHVSQDELAKIFKKFKALADKKKTIFDEDIESLITGGLGTGQEKYQLISLNVSSGTESKPSATVIITDNEIEKPAQASFGDGPVDAALNAIKEATHSECTLTSYAVKNITGGTDAQGQVTISVQLGNLTTTGKGSHTDIIIASAKAYINALNRLEARLHSPKAFQGKVEGV